jgi:sugar phosphate isomerase/epimerase
MTMVKNIANIIAHCYVNIPFTEFATYQPFIAQYRINPEIGLDDDALYIFTKQDFQDKAVFLADHDLSCTLHAPFHDMLPGALDRKVLQAVRQKLRRCFELIEIFRPRSVVCHLGYLDCIHSYQHDQWLETSLETWQQLLTIVEPFSTPVMFENTYETGPRIHKMILEALDSPLARFCLDVGHLLAFATVPWNDWLATLGPWLGQLHLHDNHGFHDEHLPVGKGNFDFQGLFSYLKSNSYNLLITLEPRSESDLWESLNALDRFSLFDHKLS